MTTVGILSRIRDRFARNDPANSVTGVFPKWQANRPIWDRYDFRLMADEGYRRNVVIYGCVRTISDSTAEPRVVVRQKQPDGKFKDVSSDHPLVTLLSEPNPDQSWFEFIEQVVTHLEVAGNAYVLKLRSRMGRVVQLVTLRPDRVKIIPDELGQVSAYRYGYNEGEWRTIPEPDVVHMKLPDPLDDFYGLSPIVVAAGVADMDTNGVDYLRAFFLNSGEPSGILTFKGRVDAEARQRVKEMWRDQHGMNTGFSGGWGGLRSLFAGAVGGWHSISVMDSDVSYQEIGSRPGKLGLDNIFGVTESRMCAAFGVPPIVVGVKIGLDRSTFSNYETAVKALWSQTLRPMYARLGDKLTVGLAREFGPQLRISFDLDDVAALQESQEARRDYAINGWNAGLLMQNEARQLTGQEAVDGGDVFKELSTTVLQPANVSPEQQKLKRRLVELFRGALAPRTITVTPTNGNGNGNGHHHAIAGPAEKHDDTEPAWKVLHQIADTAAPEIKAAMLAALAKLASSAVRKKVEKALKAGDVDAAAAAIPWDKMQTGKLSTEMRDQLQSIAEQAGVASEKIQPPGLEISFDLNNPMAAQWAQDHAGTLIKGISDESRAGVRDVLARGLVAGTDPADLADQLADYVGLSARDAGAVQTMRDSLTAAGDLSADEIDAKVSDYAETLLDQRCELIARTECLPAETLVDGAVVRAVYRRWYEGDVCEITTRAGRKFTATPNHPMLTRRGWVAAQELDERDSLVRCARQENAATPRDVDVEARPTTIGEIFDSLSAVGVHERRRTGKPDFHGDGLDGEVDVLTPDRPLAIGSHPTIDKPLLDHVLVAPDAVRAPQCESCGCLLPVNQRSALCSRPQCHGRFFQDAANRARVYAVVLGELVGRRAVHVGIDDRGGRQIVTAVMRVAAALEELATRFTEGAGCASHSDDLVHRAEISADRFGDLLPAHPMAIEFDDVVSVTLRPFAGHVFNLSTLDGYFTANGGLYTGNTITAANTGQQMLWQQAVDADLLDTDVWEQVWIATEDDQSCDDCMAMNGTTAPIGDTFSSETYGDVNGPTLHPQCRCAVGLQKAGE